MNLLFDKSLATEYKSNSQKVRVMSEHWLDISQNHYSRIENGHTGMSFEILLQLSEMLRLSIDYILTGKIDNTSHIAFIDKYNKLTSKQKDYINKHIDVFSEFDFH